MLRRLDQEAYMGLDEKGLALPFTSQMQELVTCHARATPGNARASTLRKRSLVTVSMLAAKGRMHELIHVRGALNDVTIEELQEILLHASVCCASPMDAFRAAAEVLDAG
jgi:4-carboxymuconolactone decarboxylase